MAVTQTENRHPEGARAGAGTGPVERPEGALHTGGPIIHRDDGSQDELFDHSPNDFDSP